MRNILATIILLSSFVLNADTNQLGSIKATQYVVTSENDPTVPSWAKADNPPESMTPNAVVLTNGVLKTKGGDDAAPGEITLRKDGVFAQYRDVTLSTNGVSGYTFVGGNRYQRYSFDWERVVTSLEQATNYTDEVVEPLETRIGDAESSIVTINNYLDGSNVVFSITNYNSGAYRIDSAKLKVLELTNGVYREVYNSRDEIVTHLTDFTTNAFMQATNAFMKTVVSNIADKADCDWGKYASDGIPVEAMGWTNAVVIAAPTTVFSGGLEFWKVSVGFGEVGVLVDNGAPVLTEGDSGIFHFRDISSTNYFGMTKRDDFLIGVRTDGIHVSGVGRLRVLSLTYNYVSATYPIIFWRESLTNLNDVAWQQLNDADGEPLPGAKYAPTWQTSPESFTAYINIGSEPTGFFMAKTCIIGESEFSTNMKADFKAGIVTTDGAHVVKPVYASGELTWRTFDYGSGIQVSTPSSSQVQQMSKRAVTHALTETTNSTTRAMVFDFHNGTNFTMHVYTALTNIINKLGGSVTNAPAFN